MFNGAFPKFMLLVRCLMTRCGQGDVPKGYFRNLFFNILRQLGPEMIILVIMDGKGYKTIQHIKNQVLYVFILTSILQYVPKYTFRSFRYLYFWAEFEFKAALTMGAVLLINKITSKGLLNGDLVTGLFMCVYASHFRIMWYWLEDLWF